jgi:hypothetical protein
MHKRSADVPRFEDIDLQWYISNQFVPLILNQIRPFSNLSESQLWMCFGIERFFEKDLILTCPSCNDHHVVTAIDLDLFACRKCHIVLGWKCVANLLTIAVQSIVTAFQRPICHCDAYLCLHNSQQIPVTWRTMRHSDSQNPRLCCAGRYASVNDKLWSALRRLEDLFESIDYANAEVVALATCLRSVLQVYMGVHGFQNLRLASLIGNSDSQVVDDTLCFSFLE